MQTLHFNTTTKSIVLYSGEMQKSEIICTLNNVPTVKVTDTLYEVMQKDEFEKTYPVLRVPISNTNMFLSR